MVFSHVLLSKCRVSHDAWTPVFFADPFACFQCFDRSICVSFLPLRAIRLALGNAKPYVLPTNVSSIDVGLAHQGEIFGGPQHPQSGLLFGLLFFHLESALRPIPLSPDLRLHTRVILPVNN